MTRGADRDRDGQPQAPQRTALTLAPLGAEIRTAGISQQQAVRTPPRTPHAAPGRPLTFLSKSLCSFLCGNLVIIYPQEPRGRSHRASEPSCAAPAAVSSPAAPAALPASSSSPLRQQLGPPAMRGWKLTYSRGSLGWAVPVEESLSLANSQVKGESGRGLAGSLSISPALNASSLTPSPNSLLHNTH